jgi:hypothetical protein
MLAILIKPGAHFLAHCFKYKNVLYRISKLNNYMPCGYQNT